MGRKIVFAILIVFMIQCKTGECYRTEVEITPAPNAESTTKSSGFFGGIKNFFRGSSTTTTTTLAPNIQHSGTITSSSPPKVENHPQTSLIIPQAPLMPLGPRPDTPGSSPISGQPSNPFSWPQNPSSTTSKLITNNNPISETPKGHSVTDSTIGASEKLIPGFAPYQPNKPHPSGLDLSYSNQGAPNFYNKISPNSRLVPLETSTSTTTSKSVPSTQPQSHNSNINVHQSTTTSKKPHTQKDDFPPLPTLKSPGPTPSSPDRPSSPSAWSKPLNIPNNVDTKSNSPTPPATQSTHANSQKVAFVPHKGESTTTVRPGFESNILPVGTDDEIRTLTEQLYQKETSHIAAVQVHLQGKTRSIDSTDEAKNPLLSVNENALDYPSISKIRLLFNNYESDTTTNEFVTPIERKEENDFLDSIMSSSVMRHMMQFLQIKGLVSPDPKTHRDLVKELWFTQYSRGQGKIGSSGFEHVFVYEVKNSTLIGLHNWIYFYEEENAGRLDYKGYINELNLGNKGKVLKVRFTHNNLSKPVNTLFVGTSPELEIALYTLCFKLRPDRTCPVSLGNAKFGIVTYSWRYRGKNLIGSAYPEI